MWILNIIYFSRKHVRATGTRYARHYSGTGDIGMPIRVSDAFTAFAGGLYGERQPTDLQCVSQLWLPGRLGQSRLRLGWRKTSFRRHWLFHNRAIAGCRRRVSVLRSVCYGIRLIQHLYQATHRDTGTFWRFPMWQTMMETTRPWWRAINLGM